MSANNKEITKDNLEELLKKVAREFRKANRGVTVEVILVGGAAVLANYGFRQSSGDVDAYTNAFSALKDAANKVGDEEGLPNGWFNSDFRKTRSYSPKIMQYSKYYKTFYNVLEVRTMSGAHLIAMKLMSGRQFKNDLTDIIGVLAEESERGNNLTLEDIQKAFSDLYGEWDKIPDESAKFIEICFSGESFSTLYSKYESYQGDVKNKLIDFEEKYPAVVDNDNVDDIIRRLMSDDRER